MIFPAIEQVSLFLYGKHVITLSFVDCVENTCGAKSKELLRIVFRGLYETIDNEPDGERDEPEIIRKTEQSIQDVVREITCAELQKC